MIEDKSDRQLLQETHDSIIELNAVVLGVKGKGGLVQELAETKQEVRLAVTEMKLRTGNGERDVIALFNDIMDMKPEMSKMENTIYGKTDSPGLCETLSIHEHKINTANKATAIVWAISGAILLTLLGLLIRHIT